VSFLADLQAELAGVEPAACGFDEPPAFLYLTGVSCGPSRAARLPNLGLLAQPGNSVLRDVDAGHYEMFAADNGFYGLGNVDRAAWEAAADRWLRWLVDEVVPRRDRCLYATAPDVLRWIEVDGARIPVGDAAATLERSAPYLDVIRRLGLPAALVGQDGLEDLDVPWSDMDVLFLGGSTAWKIGEAAADLSREAKARGKWVHMGRVNSWERLTRARLSGCDSADGTYLAFGPDTNWPKLARWLNALLVQARAVSDLAYADDPTRLVPPSTFLYGAAPPTMFDAHQYLDLREAA
jgi:hypothetical protein